MTTSNTVHVLLVEDDEDDFIFTRDMLDAAPSGTYDLDWASTYEAGLELLEPGGYDVCLVDYRLGPRSGLDLIKETSSLPDSPPMILLTGQDHRQVDIDAMESGATDYLVKGNIDTELLERAIRYSTKRKDAERQLMLQATHDALTGLPNRHLFLDHLNLALRRLERHAVYTAVMFIDVDRFKSINDSFGHAAGDEVLIAVGRRLSAAVRPYDTLARFGGDEFTVLCEDLQEPADAHTVASRLKAQLDGTPVRWGSENIPISASIGVALTQEGDATAEHLLRDADAAMYRAKKRCLGSIEIADELVLRSADERRLLERDVRLAFEALDS